MQYHCPRPATMTLYALIAVICCAMSLQQRAALAVSSYDQMGREVDPPRQRYTNSYQQRYQPQSQPESPNSYGATRKRLSQGAVTSTGYRHHSQQDTHGQLQQHQEDPNFSVTNRAMHKCRIWVPIDMIKKYPLATKVQLDESNRMYALEVCCPGFVPVRWQASTICRPACENCQNGLCVAPGQCQCYDEFVRNDNGDCVFTCPLGCLNGRCYLDGSCLCDSGYKLDESRKFCRPICSAGCGLNPRHNCTEPEVCGCSKGYQLTDNGCQPTCQPECGVGGYCREYNVCECDEGYTLKDGVCQSECYQKCNNGICYGRNRCICNAGFTYHEQSTNCFPL